jgi:3-deoxy-D-manno-octulosonate 8-phosphate phosphatase (KDO 8-P phosphatase)
MKNDDTNLAARLARVRILLMDCDGVLTDGLIWLTSDGDEQKTFHVRDGQGIRLLHAAGIETGVISGRASGVLSRRARELEMAFVHQHADDKVKVLKQILKAASLTEAECAFIGDDLVDVPVMQRVSVAFAVADAVAEVKQAADYVTQLPGGRGAVREVADLILKATREDSLADGDHQHQSAVVRDQS